MSDNLHEVMKSDPPRLVVQFERAPNGDERFQWGVYGSLPILTTIGFLTRIQSAIFVSTDPLPSCNEPVLAVVWLTTEKRFLYWISECIPRDSLVGMLETVKMALITSRLAQQQSPPPIITPVTNRKGILGPDGGPMRN